MEWIYSILIVEGVDDNPEPINGEKIVYSS